MFFRQMQCPVTSTFTYLLASKPARQAIIIDPVKDCLEHYLELLRKYDLKLAFALDTHVHADHITASGLLREATGCEVGMSQHSKAEGLTLSLVDQQLISCDGLDVTVWYTPGHTDDSVCFVLDDRIFTGDLLFINGTGRTDFQHGSASDSYRSITERLFALPEETLVYPGHDYKGRMVSTIGEEKRFNPRLQVANEAAYVELMDNLNLPKPKQIDVAVPANLRCGMD